MRSTPRAFGSRTRSYLSLVGVVTSLLAGGLAIPFVFGEPAAPLAVDTRPDTHYYVSADPERASDESSTTTSVSVPAASDDTLAPGPTASGEREGPTDTSSGAAVPLGATDRGVSATTIRVGVLVPDAGAAANLGLSVEGADPETIEGQYRAFFDATNAQTINGRTVEPVFRRFNPLDQGSRQAACIALTEDTEVFAVLNHATFFGDPVLCVTEQHQTPLILGSGASPSLYQRSGGLLVTAGMADARSLGGVAAMLDGAGDLSGRTIGVVHPAGAEASASFESFRAELERRGYQVAHDEALGEPATAQGQIPLAVSRMRAAGVDLLLLSHNPLITTSFVQQAASQGYQPRYVAADNALNTTDEATQNMPDAYDGAIGITAARTNEHRQGLPEPAVDARCADRYGEATGQRPERGSTRYVGTLAICSITDLFAAIATLAGPQLTRDAFAGAVPRVGRIDLAYFGSSSLSPGRPDAADTLRPLVWTVDCRCWLPIGPFVAVP